MTLPMIEISPDDAVAEGGHATVLVRGITELPAPPDFEITALPDDTEDETAEPAWSLGEQAPLSAELTPEGLVMKIGPEIVDAAELQPGTPIVFALPAANVRVELSWPDLPVTIPESRPAPVMSPSALRRRKIEAGQREARASEAMIDALAESLSVEAPPDPEARATEQGHGLADMEDVRLPVASSAMLRSDLAADQISALAPDDAAAPTSALNLAVDEPSAPLEPAIKLDPEPPAQPPALQSRALSGDTALIPVHEETSPERRGAMRRHWFSMVLALIAFPAILFALWPLLNAPVAAPPNVEASAGKLASADWITRIFEVGDISPAGVDASNLSADEALVRAEAEIFDNRAADLAERRFWLRKSIALLLAEPETRWAITQLGTLHTAAPAPQKETGYRAAKTLWEIASAGGDTVATCFLGKLYELGLGVPQSSEKAAEWFNRAERKGGCNVRHEHPRSSLTN